MILEAFEKYCDRHGITGEQYKNYIFPVFAAGFIDGQKHYREAEREIARVEAKHDYSEVGE